MYLSDAVIKILCKYNVSFFVKYKSGEYGSNIDCIEIENDIKSIIIKSYERAGYLFIIENKINEVENYENLCIHLVNENVLPQNAWF